MAERRGLLVMTITPQGRRLATGCHSRWVSATAAAGYSVDGRVQLGRGCGDPGVDVALPGHARRALSAVQMGWRSPKRLSARTSPLGVSSTVVLLDVGAPA